jgi:hypothetical protein
MGTGATKMVDGGDGKKKGLRSRVRLKVKIQGKESFQKGVKRVRLEKTALVNFKFHETRSDAESVK